MSNTKKKRPWSIIYVTYGALQHSGPWDTEIEALAWARDNNYSGPDAKGEFDINDQRVYLLDPNHRLVELTAADLGVEAEKQSS